MKTNKIIKEAVIRGVYVKPHIEIRNCKDNNKKRNFKDKEFYIPSTFKEKNVYEPFSTLFIEQKPISQDIYNAFEIIIKSIFIEQAEQANSVPDNSNTCINLNYYSPEKIAIKILDLINLLSNYRKVYIEELRMASIKGFINASNTLDGKLPNISYKTLELVLHDLDKHLT